MQPPRSQPRKGPKFLEIKILIGTLAIAVTIGLWNLFSNNAFAPAKVAPSPQSATPPQPLAGVAEGFPVLPTLVPLYQVSSLPDPAGQPVGQPAAALQPAGQPAALREVAVPTQVIVQKFKPVVSGGFTSQPASGGSGGGSPAPVTQTISSRP